MEIPQFDLIILDEVESLINHFSAPTLKDPQQALFKLTCMMKAATCGCITMDALWGAATHTFLEMNGFSHRLLVNSWRPPVPRVFTFENIESRWQERVLTDLQDGLKVRPGGCWVSFWGSSISVFFKGLHPQTVVC